jgi:hypothetical protein
MARVRADVAAVYAKDISRDIGVYVRAFGYLLFRTSYMVRVTSGKVTSTSFLSGDF